MDVIPASKESIASLISNAGKAIQDLYVCIKKDIADRSVMDAATSVIYQKTADVRIGVEFISMDLGASCRAMFISNNAFEKRHHMKNLLASISEGYKLLLGFDKARKHTLWSLLQAEIYKTGDSSLISEYDGITSRLDAYAVKCIDRDIRNLTLHYDDDMMKVFDKTVSLNNEDVIARYVCDLWDILQDMQKFCNKVDEYKENTTHIAKPVCSGPLKLNVNTLHDIVRKLISKDGKLEYVIAGILPKSSQQLDGMADNARKFQRLRSFVDSQLSMGECLQDLDNLEVLANNELLIRFMATDLASVLNAYLHSSTDIESDLNFRRVVVIKSSTLVHLYGYNENENNRSMWKAIQSFIPADNQELQKESNVIEGVLKRIVAGAIDKEQRALMVHLYDNKERRGNVEGVVSAIESLNPLKQMAEIMVLMHLYKRIQNFTSCLMLTLADNAHKQRMESQKRIEDMMDSIMKNFDSCQVPPEIRASFLATTSKIKSLLN